MIWRRIRKQLDEYISVRKADQKLVLNWYHRQFHEVSFKTVETGVHQKLASYFSGEWHGKPKPLTLYKGKVAEYPDAQRNAPAMPWTYDDKTANLRKLTEYAYHLIMAYNADEAADVLCSFDYLLNKLRFQGYKSLLADFKLYFDQFAPGHDVRTGDLVYVKIFQGIKETQNQSEELNESSLCVKIVYDLLVMAGDILVNDWTELPGNLIGRLGPMWTSHERIGKLVESSKNWCQTCKEPLLVPRYHCMVSPGYKYSYLLQVKRSSRKRVQLITIIFVSSGTFLRTTISHLISFPGIGLYNPTSGKHNSNSY